MAQQPAGIRWLHIHPAYLMDSDDLAVIALASQFREGVLPETGGTLEQSALTMASIRVVLGAWSDLENARRKKEK